MSLTLKHLPKRFFPRTPKSFANSLFGDTVREKPNPFTVSPYLKEKITKFKQTRLKEFESFTENIHDYEVFLQDECSNPKFNLN